MAIYSDCGKYQVAENWRTQPVWVRRGAVAWVNVTTLCDARSGNPLKQFGTAELLGTGDGRREQPRTK